MLELKQTKHEYYCSDSNFYVGGENSGQCVYETWQDFKDEWLGLGDNELGIDMDYNFCFRFDINQKDDEFYELKLYYLAKKRDISASTD